MNRHLLMDGPASGRNIIMLYRWSSYRITGQLPRNKHYDSSRAGYILDNFFKPLYPIEAECKALNLDYDQNTEKRLAESISVLLTMPWWLQQQIPNTIISGTPIHKAIIYIMPHLDSLMIYIIDGMLEIDNDLEEEVRPLIFGPHNRSPVLIRQVKGLQLFIAYFRPASSRVFVK